MLAALAGLTAAGLGAWLSARRLGPNPVADDASAILFAQSFPDADGLPQALSQWRGQVLVINFWATWCPPCVEEMPDLQAVRDEYRGRGVEVVGIGIDNAEKIRAFRDRLKLRLPLLVAGAGGSELGQALGNRAGALPYTALVDRNGRIVQRRLGQIKPAELRKWLETQLE
jgi:thiol-disulfide isomerase/thioredoxin